MFIAIGPLLNVQCNWTIITCSLQLDHYYMFILFHSSSSESEEDQAIAPKIVTEKPKVVLEKPKVVPESPTTPEKTKPNVNEFTEDVDDRYLLPTELYNLWERFHSVSNDGVLVLSFEIVIVS